MRTTGTAPARPWGRAALWLSGLAPFFFLSYGAANWLAAQQADVASLVFAWEQHIPFLAWTIVPYWSIDLLYGLSLFVCTSEREVDTLGRRLFTAQVVAVLCFIAFPLAFSFERPDTAGLYGVLFTWLEGFDRPFNQAPSLHVALLVVLWATYAKHLPHRFHLVLHGWCALIVLSVLTTYQHHFIDVPTGGLLGLFCLWFWPDGRPSPLAGLRLSRDPRRLRLALAYVAGSGVLFLAAFASGGTALWLLWPAVSLLLVAAAYAALGEAVFQKSPDGRMSVSARLLLAPYLAAARLNSRLWTRQRPAPARVEDGVWFGRFPSRTEVERNGFGAVVDLTAEMSAPAAAVSWRAFPSLDLAVPPVPVLRATAHAIERAVRSDRVLVACALGYSRSAAAVATWLLMTGRAQDMEEAIAAVGRAQPRVVLGASHRAAIEKASRL